MADDRTAIDWRLTTWEGARRETLRRWAALPLEQVVAALEEMERTARAWGAAGDPTLATRRRGPAGEPPPG